MACGALAGDARLFDNAGGAGVEQLADLARDVGAGHCSGASLFAAT